MQGYQNCQRNHFDRAALYACPISVCRSKRDFRARSVFDDPHQLTKIRVSTPKPFQGSKNTNHTFLWEKNITLRLLVYSASYNLKTKISEKSFALENVKFFWTLIFIQFINILVYQPTSYSTSVLRRDERSVCSPINPIFDLL